MGVISLTSTNTEGYLLRLGMTLEQTAVPSFPSPQVLNLETYRKKMAWKWGFLDPALLGFSEWRKTSNVHPPGQNKRKAGEVRVKSLSSTAENLCLGSSFFPYLSTPPPSSNVLLYIFLIIKCCFFWNRPLNAAISTLCIYPRKILKINIHTKNSILTVIAALSTTTGANNPNVHQWVNG